MEHGVRPGWLVAELLQKAKSASAALPRGQTNGGADPFGGACGLGPSISFRVVRFIQRGLERLGVDANELASRSGILTIPDDRSRVPASLLHAVWEEATRVSGRHDLGVRLTAATSASEFGPVMGELVTSSATIGDALIQLTRSSRVVTSALRFCLLVDGERCVFSLDPVCARVYHPQHVEFVVGNCVQMMRRLLGAPFSPTEVSFRQRLVRTNTHPECALGQAQMRRT